MKTISEHGILFRVREYSRINFDNSYIALNIPKPLQFKLAHYMVCELCLNEATMKSSLRSEEVGKWGGKVMFSARK